MLGLRGELRSFMRAAAEPSLSSKYIVLNLKEKEIQPQMVSLMNIPIP